MYPRAICHFGFYFNENNIASHLYIRGFPIIRETLVGFACNSCTCVSTSKSCMSDSKSLGHEKMNERAS